MFADDFLFLICYHVVGFVDMLYHRHHHIFRLVSIGLVAGVVLRYLLHIPPPRTQITATPLTEVAAGVNEHTKLRLNIDTNINLTQISEDVWGVNFAGKDTNMVNQINSRARLVTRSGISKSDVLSYIQDTSQNLSFDALPPTLFRFPGGCGSEQYDWKTGIMLKNKDGVLIEEKWPTLKEILDEAHMRNTKVMFTLNIDIDGTNNVCKTFPGFDTYDLEYKKYILEKGLSYGDISRNMYVLEKREKIIQSAQELVKTFGTRIAYYEFGNELWARDRGFTEYYNFVSDLSTQMKKINKEIKLIVQSGRSITGMTEFNSTWLSSARSNADKFQFTQVHWYDWIRDLSANKALSLDPAHIDSGGRVGYTPLISFPYRFDRIKDLPPLAITEWSLYDWEIGMSKKTMNIDSSFYIGEMLFQYMKHKIPVAVFHDANTLIENSFYRNAFYLISVLKGGTLMPTSAVDSSIRKIPICYPSCSEIHSVPAITYYAAKSSNDKLYLFVFNHDDMRFADITVENQDMVITNSTTLKTSDLYGSTSASSLQIDSRDMQVKNILLSPASVTRLQLKKSTAPPAPIISPTPPPLVCDISVLNTNFKATNGQNTLPKFAIYKSQLKNNSQNLTTSSDMQISAKTSDQSTTPVDEVSFHIRTTNPGDWWDRIPPDSVFKERAKATGAVHASYLQNLESGTYEIACNVKLKNMRDACSGAVQEGEIVKQSNSGTDPYSYTKCKGNSLIQLEVTSDQTTPTPSSPPTTPPSTIPKAFTLKTHLFVQLPSEADTSPIYRDYKNFTLMLQNQNGAGQKVFCTKNLDTQEFEPKERARGLSCTQAHQVTHEGVLYHQFTIQMSFDQFNTELYKQWEKYHFYWGVGMDPEEAQKTMRAASQMSIISDADLAKGYREEMIYMQK